ncbi:MAG: O-antigen ligase family protein, partial [Deltaproteobacteria bacterium]|nr:O-antigen ligase family protein [Deltaproteobacteria bacterium]
MIHSRIKNPAVILLGFLLLAPCILFGFDVINVMYFTVSMILAVYFCLLLVNFEIGFLTLIFMRSSLDYAKVTTENSAINVAAMASIILILFGFFYIIYHKVNIWRYEETTPFLIFLGVCGASIFFSSNYLQSVADWLRLLSVFFVYLLARNIYISEKKIKIALVVIFLSTLIPVLVAYYEFFAGSTSLGRLRGTFNHPNAFATYLLLILVFSLTQIMERKSFISRKMLILAFLLTFFVFVMTLSIGAWIVFACTVGLMGLLRYRRLLGFMPIFLIFVVLLVPAVKSRIFDMLDPSLMRGHSSWEWRLKAWKDIFYLVQQRPFFGHGLSMVELKLGYLAHNDYLRLLAEVGILGLLAYLNL